LQYGRPTITPTVQLQPDSTSCNTGIVGTRCIRVAPITGGDTFKSWTPRFAVEYQFTDRIMAYASAAKGFKGGGTNDTVADIDTRLSSAELLITSEAINLTVKTQTETIAQDAVDALVKVAFSKETIGRAVNIGNSTEISILKLAEFVKERVKSSSEIVFLDYQAAYGDGFEDMQRRVPDVTLIKHLVGWEPQLSLENIVDDIAKEMLH
jgi:hypothetical protein